MAFQPLVRANLALHCLLDGQNSVLPGRLRLRAERPTVQHVGWAPDPTKEVYMPPGIAQPPAAHCDNHRRNPFLPAPIIHFGQSHRNSGRRQVYIPPQVASPPILQPPPRQAVPRHDPHKASRSRTPSDAFSRRYKTGKILGKGGQGCALLGHDSKTGRIVAIKKLERYRHTMALKYINREILLADSHPNIIKLIEIETDGNGVEVSASMVLEFCNGGNLDDFCERFFDHQENIPEHYILYVFRELAKALAYLHSGHGGQKKVRNWFGIVHRDIKPENIMIHHSHRTSLGLPLIKLIDFDCACIEDHEPVGSCAGTEDWLPPEIANSHSSADIWSLSAVIFHMSGCRPSVYEWPPADCQHLGQRPPPFDMCTRGYSGTLDKMVRHGLAQHPEDRPTAVKLAKELRKMHIDQGVKRFGEWMAKRPWIWIDNTPGKPKKGSRDTRCTIS